MNKCNTISKRTIKMIRKSLPYKYKIQSSKMQNVLKQLLLDYGFLKYDIQKSCFHTKGQFGNVVIF